MYLANVLLFPHPDNGTIDFDEFCRLYMKNSQAEQERKEAVASSIEKLFPTSDGPVELKKVGYHLILLREDGGGG